MPEMLNELGLRFQRTNMSRLVQFVGKGSSELWSVCIVGGCCWLEGCHSCRLSLKYWQHLFCGGRIWFTKTFLISCAVYGINPTDPWSFNLACFLVPHNWSAYITLQTSTHQILLLVSQKMRQFKGTCSAQNIRRCLHKVVLLTLIVIAEGMTADELLSLKESELNSVVNLATENSGNCGTSLTSFSAHPTLRYPIFLTRLYVICSKCAEVTIFE